MVLVLLDVLGLAMTVKVAIQDVIPHVTQDVMTVKVVMANVILL